MNIAAFFDIDGTVYRGSLMIEHFRKLMKYEVIEPNIWYNKINDLYVRWKNRQGDYDDFMEELAQAYIENLTNLNLNHIEFISDQVINLKGDAIYKYSRSRIQWHKEMGHRIIFVSGSPDFLVRKMAQKYGADDYIGSGYIIDENGNFTGKVNKMWDSENKNKAIKNFITQYQINVAKSYSYGDTNGDYSMLKLMGNPTAINPSHELMKIIKDDVTLREKIDIIIERKDVIYHVKGNVEFE
ncbi:MAG: HAD-IB family hydrolase [Clostridiales bacterium]|nr:HAD-IB family hydrolase [Clostridiales bacterium]